MLRPSIAAAAGLATALLAPVAPAADPAACHVGFSTYGDSVGFNTDVVITNTSGETLYGWTLRFQLAAGQGLLHGWGAEFTADGGAVTANSLPYNRIVDSGRSVQVGFRAAGPLDAGPPAEFRINDYVCTS